MTNINYIMDMTKSFLDGEIDCISFYLDFPYEVEKRYRKMVREDRDYAELIFDFLVEEGTNKYDELSDTQLLLIRYFVKRMTVQIVHNLTR